MSSESVVYRQRESTFSDREAWALFRWAAIAETITWTLLIIGIIFKHFQWPLYDYVLPIAGSLHGIFVICYMMLIVAVFRSMRWSVVKMLIAEAVSVVPYLALVFEQYEAQRRREQYYFAVKGLAIAATADSSGRS